jgi:uncharacterized protein (DUF433 family)
MMILKLLPLFTLLPLGMSYAEIMEDFPQLSTEQILAVLAYPNKTIL